MTSGLASDFPATKRQLSAPHPCENGKTWLRHKENSQTGKIDLMVLEGKYSTEEMIREPKRMRFFKDNAPHNQCISRVIDHLNHLRNGSARSLAHGQEPHHLKPKQVRDKWSFSFD